MKNNGRIKVPPINYHSHQNHTISHDVNEDENWEYRSTGIAGYLMRMEEDVGRLADKIRRKHAHRQYKVISS